MSKVIVDMHSDIYGWIWFKRGMIIDSAKLGMMIDTTKLGMMIDTTELGMMIDT